MVIWICASFVMLNRLNSEGELLLEKMLSFDWQLGVLLRFWHNFVFFLYDILRLWWWTTKVGWTDMSEQGAEENSGHANCLWFRLIQIYRQVLFNCGLETITHPNTVHGNLLWQHNWFQVKEFHTLGGGNRQNGAFLRFNGLIGLDITHMGHQLRTKSLSWRETSQWFLFFPHVKIL